MSSLTRRKMFIFSFLLSFHIVIISCKSDPHCLDKNEIFLECGPSCEATCENPTPSCDHSCNPGCFCKHGYLIGPRNKCILSWKCPHDDGNHPVDQPLNKLPSAYGSLPRPSSKDYSSDEFPTTAPSQDKFSPEIGALFGSKQQYPNSPDETQSEELPLHRSANGHPPKNLSDDEPPLSDSPNELTLDNTTRDNERYIYPIRNNTRNQVGYLSQTKKPLYDIKDSPEDNNEMMDGDLHFSDQTNDAHEESSTARSRNNLPPTRLPNGRSVFLDEHSPPSDDHPEDYTDELNTKDSPLNKTPYAQTSNKSLSKSLPKTTTYPDDSIDNWTFDYTTRKPRLKPQKFPHQHFQNEALRNEPLEDYPSRHEHLNDANENEFPSKGYPRKKFPPIIDPIHSIDWPSTKAPLSRSRPQSDHVDVFNEPRLRSYNKNNSPNGRRTIMNELPPIPPPSDEYNTQSLSDIKQPNTRPPPGRSPYRPFPIKFPAESPLSNGRSQPLDKYSPFSGDHSEDYPDELHTTSSPPKRKRPLVGNPDKPLSKNINLSFRITSPPDDSTPDDSNDSTPDDSFEVIPPSKKPRLMHENLPYNPFQNNHSRNGTVEGDNPWNGLPRKQAPSNYRSNPLELPSLGKSISNDNQPTKNSFRGPYRNNRLPNEPSSDVLPPGPRSSVSWQNNRPRGNSRVFQPPYSNELSPNNTDMNVVSSNKPTDDTSNEWDTSPLDSVTFSPQDNSSNERLPRDNSSTSILRRRCSRPFEEYLECGPVCSPFCNSPHEECVDQCVKGCFCKPGYVRGSDRKCILKSECPPAPTCGENEEYKSIGSVCSVTCFGSVTFCPMIGVYGCFCKPGFVRDPIDICIPQTKCPQRILGPCEAPPDPGLGDAEISVYYYDVQQKRCLQFIYSGCDGNENIYETKEDCMNKCGEKKKNKLELKHS